MFDVLEVENGPEIVQERDGGVCLAAIVTLYALPAMGVVAGFLAILATVGAGFLAR